MRKLAWNLCPSCVVCLTFLPLPFNEVGCWSLHPRPRTSFRHFFHHFSLSLSHTHTLSVPRLVALLLYKLLMTAKPNRENERAEPTSPWLAKATQENQRWISIFGTLWWRSWRKLAWRGGDCPLIVTDYFCSCLFSSWRYRKEIKNHFSQDRLLKSRKF